MRQLRLLGAVALIGGTAVACTYDGYSTQYVMAPVPPYAQYVMAPTYATSYPTFTTGYTTHYVVAPNYGPRYPAALRVTEGYTPSAYVVARAP